MANKLPTKKCNCYNCTNELCHNAKAAKTNKQVFEVEYCSAYKPRLIQLTLEFDE